MNAKTACELSSSLEKRQKEKLFDEILERIKDVANYGYKKLLVKDFFYNVRCYPDCGNDLIRTDHHIDFLNSNLKYVKKLSKMGYKITYEEEPVTLINNKQELVEKTYHTFFGSKVKKEFEMKKTETQGIIRTYTIEWCCKEGKK